MRLQFLGKFLVNTNKTLPQMKYQILEDITDYDKRCNCIIVRTLNPDLSILLGSISLIVSEKGFPLAHLAIVAREHNIPILLISDIINKIPNRGKLSLKEEVVNIEN
jgi:phosphohistidine swiveling domain-containing protein